MKVLGKRISILKKEDLLSIVILPGLEKKQLAALFFWLFAWTVCGVIVLANYFQTNNKDVRLFIIVYMAFWAYFEFNMVRSFMWKRAGKEKLWVQQGILYYQRELNRKGKIMEFNTSLVSPVEIVELRPTRLADTISQSFWIKGGERLQFTVQGRTYLFGMQITDNEASTLRLEINKVLH